MTDQEKLEIAIKYLKHIASEPNPKTETSFNRLGTLIEIADEALSKLGIEDE